MKKGIWIIVAALLSLGAIIGANALVSTTNVNTMKKKLSTEEQIKIAPKAAVDSATVALKKAQAVVNAIKKTGCNRRTCQTICGTTPHRQRQPSGDYR